MLKRYTLASKRGEGWAVIVIDTSIGFFSVVSDWGSWAYIWSNTGCEFRQFLTELDEDYLGGKLMQGRPDRDEYDQDRTRRAIFDWLRAMARESFGDARRWAAYVRERDLYRRARCAGDFWSEGDFREWYEETEIGDAYELRGEVLNLRFQAFYKRTWPRFVAMLKDELAAELQEKGPADASA